MSTFRFFFQECNRLIRRTKRASFFSYHSLFIYRYRTFTFSWGIWKFGYLQIGFLVQVVSFFLLIIMAVWILKYSLIYCTVCIILFFLNFLLKVVGGVNGTECLKSRIHRISILWHCLYANFPLIVFPYVDWLITKRQLKR